MERGFLGYGMRSENAQDGVYIGGASASPVDSEAVRQARASWFGRLSDRFCTLLPPTFIFLEPALILLGVSCPASRHLADPKGRALGIWSTVTVAGVNHQDSKTWRDCRVVANKGDDLGPRFRANGRAIVFPFFHGLIHYAENSTDLHVGHLAVNPHPAQMLANRAALALAGTGGDTLRSAKFMQQSSDYKYPTAQTADRKTDGEYFVWRKLSAAKWADAWLERLAFLGPQRAMTIEFPGARTVRVEAHGISKNEAAGLLKMFGGKVSRATQQNPLPAEPRPPIRVRGRLLIVSTEAELQAHTPGKSKESVVLIPAGMAFGTGEHATTSTCLRLLADIAQEVGAAPWEALDLGTGSGILAIAARKLGARAVDAADYDPHAVRTAKANVRANGIKKLRIKRLDVSDWLPDRTWDVVCANLFSDLLAKTTPKLAKALPATGYLIFSGILRKQETEVVSAFRAAGLTIVKTVRKGKWVSGVAQRTQKRRRS